MTTMCVCTLLETGVPGDFKFKHKVKGEIEKPHWFEIDYIDGLKKQPRTYVIRSFKGVLPFLERIKFWVDMKKQAGDL